LFLKNDDLSREGMLLGGRQNFQKSLVSDVCFLSSHLSRESKKMK
jgi:hypothetical protein